MAGYCKTAIFMIGEDLACKGTITVQIGES